MAYTVAEIVASYGITADEVIARAEHPDMAARVAAWRAEMVDCIFADLFEGASMTDAELALSFVGSDPGEAATRLIRAGMDPRSENYDNHSEIEMVA